MQALVPLWASLLVGASASASGGPGPLKGAQHSLFHHPIQLLDQPFDISAPASGAQLDPVPTGEKADVFRKVLRAGHLGTLHKDWNYRNPTILQKLKNCRSSAALRLPDGPRTAALALCKTLQLQSRTTSIADRSTPWVGLIAAVRRATRSRFGASTPDESSRGMHPAFAPIE